ncbi:multicopy suppressor of BFA (Brefeldin A), partial [Teratosphaeriaceae sp. CCFEE 6253]
KLDFWKGDQQRKTKENVSKAQAEIDRLEAEADGAEGKPNGEHAAPEKKVNGDAHASASATAGAEKEDGAGEVTNGVEKVKIETEDPAAVEDGA